MAARNKQEPEISGREVTLSRVYDAPRELVWKAWTEPEHAAQWWGPDGFTNTIIEMAVRPGGVWRFTMHAPWGQDFPNRIVFEEVVPPERLAYAHGSDEDGAEPDFHAIVTFKDLDGKTEVTMRSIFPSAEALEYVAREFKAIEGGRQTLARLAEYLELM